MKKWFKSSSKALVVWQTEMGFKPIIVVGLPYVGRARMMAETGVEVNDIAVSIQVP